MSGASDHINKTLEPLKLQAASKLSEVRKILAAINTVEEMHGLPKTSLSDLDANIPAQENVGLTDSVSVTISRPGLSGNAIRPDEYLGKPPLEAAKQYIRRVGHAVHIDEIAEAISKGGAATRGNDWKEKLLISLIRSTLDAVKVQEGIFGLRDFYTEDQLKELMDTRRPRAPIGRRGKKPSRKLKGGQVSAKRKEPKEAVWTTSAPVKRIDATAVKFLRMLSDAGENGLSTPELAKGLGYKSGRSLPFLVNGIGKALSDAKIDPKTVYEGKRVGNKQRWFAREKLEEALKLMKA